MAFANLDEVRDRIDAVDQSLLHNLVDRTELIKAVKSFKSRQGLEEFNAMRPAREKQVLEALVAEAQDRVPARLILMLWRELIGWATQVQSAMSVHLCMSHDDIAFRQAVADHFGSFAPIITHGSVQDLVAGLLSSQNDVAVLPAAADSVAGWLGDFVTGYEAKLEIQSILPMLGGPVDGYIIGHPGPASHEGDSTLIGLVSPDNATDKTLMSTLAQAGLDARLCHVAGRGAIGDMTGVLIAVDGYVRADGPELEHLRGMGSPGHIHHLGSYPAQIELGETA